MKKDMPAWGFSDRFLAEANSYPGLYIGRVISQYKNIYKVVCENGILLAEISGKYGFSIKNKTDYPAVGDFVLLDRDTDANGNAIIRRTLSRKSAIVRKAAGATGDEQVIASNIDKVFICMSLNNDFNLRRLERYLSIVWDSGAVPIVVLTKADLCADIFGKLAEVNFIALGAEVIVSSGITEDGLTDIKDFVKPQETIAFIGSSGVGKTTIINRLLGEDILATKEIRNDDKGKHATTRRELIMLKNGALVIDTPGMREIGIETADLAKTFSDIDELATQCKFNDCTHDREPGCAVQAAVSDGRLSAERFANYLKLKKEIQYDGLNSRQIETKKLNKMFDGIGGMKNARKNLKDGDKRKLRK